MIETATDDKKYYLLLIFLLSFVSYGLYDAGSTVLAADYLDSFQYESSGLLRAVGMSSDAPGFLAIKLGVVFIALMFTLYLGVQFPGLRTAAIWVLSGAILAGIFVGTSNLNIILNGHSIFLFGQDPNFVGTAIIGIFGLDGILMCLAVPGKDATIARQCGPLET